MEEGEKEEKEEKEENEEQQPKEEEATSSENKEETKEEEASTSEVKEEEKKEEDDDEGWITPDNINKYHAKHYGWNSKKEAKTYDVACMTADFAMQVSIIILYLN